MIVVVQRVWDWARGGGESSGSRRVVCVGRRGGRRMGVFGRRDAVGGPIAGKAVCERTVAVVGSHHWGEAGRVESGKRRSSRLLYTGDRRFLHH